MLGEVQHLQVDHAGQPAPRVLQRVTGREQLAAPCSTAPRRPSPAAAPGRWWTRWSRPAGPRRLAGEMPAPEGHGPVVRRGHVDCGVGRCGPAVHRDAAPAARASASTPPVDARHGGRPARGFVVHRTARRVELGRAACSEVARAACSAAADHCPRAEIETGGEVAPRPGRGRCAARGPATRPPARSSAADRQASRASARPDAAARAGRSRVRRARRARRRCGRRRRPAPARAPRATRHSARHQVRPRSHSVAAAARASAAVAPRRRARRDASPWQARLAQSVGPGVQRRAP